MIYLFFLWLADWDRERERERETERPLGAEPDQERDLERLKTNKPELCHIVINTITRYKGNYKGK